MKVKSIMRVKDLRVVGAQRVAQFTSTGKLREPGKNFALGLKPTADLSRPGFYFMVHPRKETVYARFYVGRQRSKQGFNNTASQLRLQRSSVGEVIMNAHVPFDVFFLPLEHMKPLTNGFMKGKFALLLTRSHNDKFQNMEEMNRMLSDNFKFYAQKY